MKKLLCALMALSLVLTMTAAFAEAVVNDWSVLPGQDTVETGDSVLSDYTAVVEEYADVLADVADPTLLEAMRSDELYADLMFAVDSGKYGYVLKDLDGDGNIELMIAIVEPADPSTDKLVLELVTNDGTNGKTVFISGERSRYYYAGDNKFAYQGSNGADDSLETTYALENGELVDLGTVTDAADYVQAELEVLEAVE